MGNNTGGKGGSESIGPRTAAQQSQGLYSWAAPIMQQALDMQRYMTGAYAPAMWRYGQGKPFNTPLAREFDRIKVANIPLNYDVSRMSEWAGARAAMVQPYQQAQQSIRANTPRGGAQQQALTNAAMQQAQALDQARAGLNAQQRAVAQQNAQWNAQNRQVNQLMQRQFEAQELARAQGLMQAGYAAGIPMYSQAAGANTQAAMQQGQQNAEAKGGMGQGIGSILGSTILSKGGRR